MSIPLSYAAWLDDDGEHVWLSHECAEGFVTFMLPNTWRVVGKDKIEPSFTCDDCGAHEFLELGEHGLGGRAIPREVVES